MARSSGLHYHKILTAPDPKVLKEKMQRTQRKEKDRLDLVKDILDRSKHLKYVTASGDPLYRAVE
jgi:hypothetical protein